MNGRKEEKTRMIACDRPIVNPAEDDALRTEADVLKLKRTAASIRDRSGVLQFAKRRSASSGP